MGFIKLTTGQWLCRGCGKRTEPETKATHIKPKGWTHVDVHDVGMYGVTESRLMCAECVESRREARGAEQDMLTYRQ